MSDTGESESESESENRATVEVIEDTIYIAGVPLERK
jgi:hypothetical protein